MGKPEHTRVMMKHLTDFQCELATIRKLAKLIHCGGRPFEDTECVSCETLEDHHTHRKCYMVDQVAAYKRASDEPLRRMHIFYEKYLEAKSVVEIESIRQRFDRTINRMTKALDLLRQQHDEKIADPDREKAPKCSTSADFAQKHKEMTDEINTTREIMDGVVEYYTNQAPARRAQDWENFIDAMKKLENSDVKWHTSEDADLAWTYEQPEGRNPRTSAAFNYNTTIDRNARHDTFLLQCSRGENDGRFDLEFFEKHCQTVRARSDKVANEFKPDYDGRVYESLEECFYIARQQFRSISRHRFHCQQLIDEEMKMVCKKMDYDKLVELIERYENHRKLIANIESWSDLTRWAQTICIDRDTEVLHALSQQEDKTERMIRRLVQVVSFLNRKQGTNNRVAMFKDKCNEFILLLRCYEYEDERSREIASERQLVIAKLINLDALFTSLANFVPGQFRTALEDV
ncbi:unnamed protein product [Caenorhabditis sp. 36 PRJEB53466]|nr:unnamed protein product [Caenorhabditis sp. 36 PRJEB53466]